MDTVDTHVAADPDSCRATADWLQRLTDADQQAATAAYHARSASEACWHGAAADAFRDQLGRQAADVDQLAKAVDRASSGLREFADTIATVYSRMVQAVQLAQRSGLPVTGTIIHGPTPNAPTGAVPEVDQNEAFSEIQGTVADARRIERAAHAALKSALQDTNTITASLSSPASWISKGLSYAGTAHATATKLAGEGAKQLDFADEFDRLSADTTMPASVREAHIERLLEGVGMKAEAASSNARLLGYIGATSAGTTLLDPLTRTFAGDAEGVAGAVGGAFPIAGVVATGALTGIDIAQGKPVAKSVEVNFGGLAVGTAASTGTEAGLLALGAAGGPVTLAAIGVGFAASWAWGYFQDHSWHDFTRDLGFSD